jgi:hypothetical protein
MSFSWQLIYETWETVSLIDSAAGEMEFLVATRLFVA